MNVITWNVLHRIHAVNWEEPSLANHADEAARIAGIAEWIEQQQWLVQETTEFLRESSPGIVIPTLVICLQEVSGDQAAAVKALPGAQVFEMKYPRMPRYYRNTEPTVLTDAAEYLVMLVFGNAKAKIVAEAAFPTDHGKGFLAVDVDGTTVICTHVSFGEKHAAQCAQIVEEANKHDRVVVCGDFNAAREICLSRFPGFAAAELAGDLPTRPRAEVSTKSQNIDHVLVRGRSIGPAFVLDGLGLSDHNPVAATIL